MFPRRVTVRRITPRRRGLSTPSSCLGPSSLSFPDMLSWLAAQLMLSLRAWNADISLFPGGDLDRAAPDAGEWNPSPSGLAFRLCCFRMRCRC